MYSQIQQQTFVYLIGGRKPSKDLGNTPVSVLNNSEDMLQSDK